MTKQKIKKLIDEVELWENGFSFGLKSGGIILSYDIAADIPFVKDKKKIAKEILERLTNYNKLQSTNTSLLETCENAYNLIIQKPSILDEYIAIEEVRKILLSVIKQARK